MKDKAQRGIRFHFLTETETSYYRYKTSKSGGKKKDPELLSNHCILLIYIKVSLWQFRQIQICEGDQVILQFKIYRRFGLTKECREL